MKTKHDGSLRCDCRRCCNEDPSRDPIRQRHTPVDLINARPQAFADVVLLALKIGVADEMEEYPVRTAKQLAQLLCSQYRGGHMRALKQAYSAGRFHVHCMGSLT